MRQNCWAVLLHSGLWSQLQVAKSGLYIAYALPIMSCITLARKTFVKGPFSLCSFGLITGWVAVLWVVIFTILFYLVVAYPITKDTLNYIMGNLK